MCEKMKWGAVCLVAGFFWVTGCSTPKIIPVLQTTWSQNQMRADGMDSEWPQAQPQYEEHQISVRVMNNADAVFVCVSVGDEGLKKKIEMNGLTLTLDPEGEAIPPFKIGFNNLVAPEMSRITLPDSVDITYPYSSGPMTMSFSEAREKGIEMGLGFQDNSRMVLEAFIRFGAISSFGDIRPGTRLTLSIESKETSVYPGSSPPGFPGFPGGKKGPEDGKSKQEREKIMAPFEAVMDLVLKSS